MTFSRFASCIFLASALPAASAQGDVLFRDGLEEFVTLKGQAGTTLVLPNARIVASAGGAAVETAADGDGRFELSLSGAGDAPVHVFAYGTGAQQGIAFAALPDTLQRLAARAGEDRVITAEDTLYLNLSPFTTAIRAAMLAANSAIRSPADFDRAARTWRGYGQARTVALMVETVALGVCPRAPEFADSVAMVETPAAARRAWNHMWDDTGWHCLTNEDHRIDALVDDAAMRVPQAVPVDAELTVACAYDRSRQCRATAYRVAGDGSGTLTSHFRADRSFAWTRSAGVLTLDPLPQSDSFYRYSTGVTRTIRADGVDETLSVLATVDQTQLRLRATEGPGGSVLLAIADERRWTFPAEPRLPAEYYRTGFGWPSPTLRDREPLWAWDVAGSDWVLPAQRAPGFDQAIDVLDVHRFAADGTGSEQRGGRTFAWRIDDSGHLRIDYSDGVQAELVRRSFEHPAFGVVAFMRSAQGESFLAAGPALQRNADTFDGAVPASFTDLWADSPLDVFWEYSPDGAPFVLAAGGTGHWLTRPVQWTQAGGILRVDRFNPDGAYRLRDTWEIVAVHGDEWYALRNQSALVPPANTPSPDPAVPSAMLLRMRRTP